MNEYKPPEIRIVSFGKEFLTSATKLNAVIDCPPECAGDNPLPPCSCDDYPPCVCVSHPDPPPHPSPDPQPGPPSCDCDSESAQSRMDEKELSAAEKGKGKPRAFFKIADM